MVNQESKWIFRNFYSGDNFWNFLYALWMPSSFIGGRSKKKEFAPQLLQTPVDKGGKNISGVASPARIFIQINSSTSDGKPRGLECKFQLCKWNHSIYTAGIRTQDPWICHQMCCCWYNGTCFSFFFFFFQKFWYI